MHKPTVHSLVYKPKRPLNAGFIDWLRLDRRVGTIEWLIALHLLNKTTDVKNRDI